MKAGARLKCTQRSVWGASPESPLLVTLQMDSQTTYSLSSISGSLSCCSFCYSSLLEERVLRGPATGAAPPKYRTVSCGASMFCSGGNGWYMVVYTGILRYYGSPGGTERSVRWVSSNEFFSPRNWSWCVISAGDGFLRAVMLHQ